MPRFIEVKKFSHLNRVIVMFSSLPLLLLLFFYGCHQNGDNIKAFKIFGTMVNKPVEVNSSQLPQSDSIEVPKNVNKTDLESLLKTYLQIHDLMFIKRGNRLIVTDDKEYQSLWETDVGKAFEKSKSLNKPLIVKFGTRWCKPCREQDQMFFSEEKVFEQLHRFVLLKIDGEEFEAYKSDDTNPLVLLLNKYNLKNESGYPRLIFINTSGFKLFKGLKPDYSYYWGELKLFADGGL